MFIVSWPTLSSYVLHQILVLPRDGQVKPLHEVESYPFFNAESNLSQTGTAFRIFSFLLKQVRAMRTSQKSSVPV